jgi:TM2 domain-containing membrane protein YozV
MDTTMVAYPGEASEKSRGVALALATLLGVFGGHRFYVGKTGTGVLMAATLGGAGIWWLYDMILVASGSFRDANDRLVRRWDPEEASPGGTLPSEVREELDVRRQAAVPSASGRLARPGPRRRHFDPSLASSARGAPGAGRSPGGQDRIGPERQVRRASAAKGRQGSSVVVSQSSAQRIDIA